MSRWGGSAAGELVVRADPRWVGTLLRRVARRLRLLLVPIAVGLLVGAVLRDWDPVLSSLVLVGAVLAVGTLVLLPQVAWRWASLTLTDTHLVLRLPWRRRSVARADVDALVLGWFTERPDQTRQRQLVVADRRGRRRLTTPEAAWAPEDVTRLADALGVELRPAAARRDRLLVPWWVRHERLAAAGFVVVAVAVVASVGAVVLAARTASTARAAESAAESFRRWAVDVQQARPSLESVDVEVHPDDDPEVDEVLVVVELLGTSATGEADPVLLGDLVDSACDRATEVSADVDVAVPTEVRATIGLTDRPLLSDGGRAERLLDVSCDEGSGALDPALAWLTHVADHPFDPGVVRVDVEPGSVGSTSSSGSVDPVGSVGVRVRVLAPDDVDRAVEVGCARGDGMDVDAAATVTLLVSTDDAETEVPCAEEVSPLRSPRVATRLPS